MKSVVAIVANIKKFRWPFYNSLADALLAHGVKLTVVYSDPDPAEVLKMDSTDLPPPTGLKVQGRALFGNKLLWQLPPVSLLKSADLVIIVQANGYLLNYLLLPLGCLGIKRIAFWGHAFNHQGNPNSIQERFKRLLATKVQWWFTYTVKTADYLTSLGVSKDKLTVIENAVDTKGFSQAVAGVTHEDILDTRIRLGILPGASCAIFCGSLYAGKKLDFLVRVGDELHKKYPAFSLIVIGDGPEHSFICDASKSRSWIKYCGPQFGKEKAQLFAASDFFLHPGEVGLAILDSFSARLPFVTAHQSGHGPEVAYLEHGNNGLMLPFEVGQFSKGVSKLILDRDFLQSLKQGALASGSRYTIENMVCNVSRGILKCLEIPDKEARLS